MSDPAASTSSGGGTGHHLGRTDVTAYARPHLGRALLDLATSVVPYLALSALMYFALDVSYLLTLALAVTARSCDPGGPTNGSERSAACWSSPPSTAGVTNTPSIMRPPGISIAAAWVTCRP